MSFHTNTYFNIDWVKSKYFTMFYKNNWFAWTFDNGPEYGPKLTPTSEFKILIKNTIDSPIKSYYEELLENGRVIRDTFSGELDLLFSGGVDSEVILRVYLDLKIPINVYIFKYENDYNLLEYAQAVKTCEALGVKPRIIDFELQKFFENEAYEYFKTSYSCGPGWIPHMKMTEYCDGTPIIGSGETYARRTSRDLTQKYPWVIELDEKCHHWAIFHKTVDRPAITDWYEYSPEVTAAYLRLPYVQQLLADNIKGKLTNISSKAFIHQAYWPDLVDRKKLIGFEGPEPSKEKPDITPFMIDFGLKHIFYSVKEKVYTYTPDELLNLIGA